MSKISELYEKLHDIETKRNDLYIEMEKIKKEIQIEKELDFSKYNIEDLLSYGKEIQIGSNDGNYYIYIYDNGKTKVIKEFITDIEDLKIFLQIISK